MSAEDRLLAATPILNFGHPSIEQLVAERGWKALATHDRIGAVYDFVRNEIAFGSSRAPFESGEVPSRSARPCVL